MGDSRSTARQRLGILTAQLGQYRQEPRGNSATPAGATGATGATGAGSSPTIVATVPLTKVPDWATLERQLFAQMEQAIHPYVKKYTHPDGRLVYAPGLRGAPDLALDPDGGITSSRDGLDDFYESFYNWPLLYLLGGDDELLTLGQRQFDATTKLGVELGHVFNEYEVGYDQFHQSESMIYFYLLCMADPTHPVNAERAQRFAGLFMNEDPEAHNYDPKHNILRSAHNGSKGARETVWGAYGGPGFSSGGMARYGLPYEDVMGVDGRLIASIEDLEDPENARRMGETMQRRMGMGDTATNLHVCTMMQNAFIMSGNERFKQWLLHYVTGWMERSEQQPNHLLPDNVSLNGVVGGEIDGKWYGSSYGWSWPHGFYNIAMASLLAGVSCFQLSGDRKFLQLPRNQINAIMSLGKVEALDMSKMSLAEHWLPQMCAIAGHTIADAHGDAATTTGGSTLATRDRVAASAGDALNTPTFVVPYRYIDSGWFDYQPMAPMYPMMLYNVCGEDEDMATLETIREKEGFDWAGVYSFRTKEDAGHEAPWLCYLKGENPSFPVQILQAAMAQVYRRSEQVRQDKTVGSDGRYDRSMPARGHDIHHWQVLNPVTTEALIMLTLGAPQMLYNGGLLLAPLRYFDLEKRRPGLPKDVAALVSGVSKSELEVTLCNLSAVLPRSLVIQAGTMREHTFTSVSFSELTTPWPSTVGDYAAPDVQAEMREAQVNGPKFTLELPPGTQIMLKIGLLRNTSTPTYSFPF